MQTRVTALALAIATVLALSVGAALAIPRDDGGWAAHDAMHGSQQMRAMHAQMPAGTQTECDAMHAQMSSQMGSMMGGTHGGGGMGRMHEEIDRR